MWLVWWQLSSTHGGGDQGDSTGLAGPGRRSAKLSIPRRTQSSKISTFSSAKIRRCCLDHLNLLLQRQPGCNKIRPMVTGIRRAVSLAAIYVIALQTILLGVAPVAGFGSIAGDPFSFICRSDGQPFASNNQTPGSKDHQHGQRCLYCNLCSTSALPLVPSNPIDTVFPLRLRLVLRPALCAPRVGLVSDPKLARGPPQILVT